MTQQQVDGQSVILGLWEGQYTGTPMEDMRWLAYILATAYHETATKIWPIREYGLGKGHEYGEPDGNGNTFYGRGFVQLTWKENYERASAILGLIDDRDLSDFPDLALDSLIAARVMFRGMAEGWFTGVKLGDYFNEDTDDPINARRIINGNDKDELIAGYYDTFLEALENSYERGLEI
jgi:predicted chitinase